jgi:hypothetical protein
MNQYELSKQFWDFAFLNPDKIKPTHAAIYFFAMEHCNRLGWKKKFGLPTSMTIEAIGMKSYSVYKKHFDDIIEWGLFEIVEYSKNQYSSNIIALSESFKANNKANSKANSKALNNATVKHASKQSESTIQSTGESTGSIDKPITIEPITNNSSTSSNIQYPFDSEKFLTAWKEWKQYKSEQHKFKFKSDLSEQKSLNLLFNESHKSEETAIKMIDYAIAKGWQGWVAKDDVNFYSGNATTTKPKKDFSDPKYFD